MLEPMLGRPTHTNCLHAFKSPSCQCETFISLRTLTPPVALLKGFIVSVDGDRVIFHRNTRRIRATTPLRINVEWSAEGMTEFSRTQEFLLNPQGSNILSADNWYNLISDEKSIISVNNLCLKWENELIHDFGKARNFHVIKSCEVLCDGDNGHKVSIRLAGEDMFGNPLENTQKTLIYDLSSYKVIKEIGDFFPSLCQFQFENPPTREFLISLGDSHCGRFRDYERFSISYDGTAPNITSEKISEALQVVTNLSHENDTVAVTFANGERHVISIRSTLVNPDELYDSVKDLDEALSGFVFAEDVNFGQVAPTNFIFSNGVHDAHRLILERSMEKEHYNVRYVEFHPKIETDKLVVSEIKGWEISDAPHDAETLHFLVLKATLENKFTGKTKNVQAKIKFLNRIPTHKKQIHHFIPFFGDEAERLDYYHSISGDGATRVGINLSQSLSTLFDLECTEAEFSMCPFTLTLFDARMGTPIGPLPPELIQSPTPNLTHVEQLTLIEKWGRGWEERLVAFGFWDNKYLDPFLDEIESVDSFNPESFERFQEKINQAFAEERITDEMLSIAVDMAKQKLTK